MPTKKKVNWEQPHNVDHTNMLTLGTLLPPMSVIPSEFKDFNNKWCLAAMKLFFDGGKLPKVKEGIDPLKAKNHLVAILSSFAPKHEHKEAAAGWLMSMWYEDINE